MAKVRANGRWNIPGASGSIASGWKVNTYIAGTSTPKNTYTDYLEGTPNANPVVLDSRGEATIYWSGTYKIVVTDENDNTVWTEDNYGGGETFILTGNYNIVKNGSFETDLVLSGEPDNWTIVDYTNGSHSLDATDQYHGLNSLKFTSTGSGGGYATSDYFEAQEAKDLTFQWSLKSSVADVRNVVDVLWYTSAKTLISTTGLYDDSATNPTSWTETTSVATPPSTARYAQVRVYGCHSSDATAGSTWFDGLIAISLIGTMAAQDASSVDITGGDAVLDNFSLNLPVTTGTGTAYVGVVGETSLTTDKIYNIRIHASNTAAFTLTLDGLTTEDVKLLDGNDPYVDALKIGMAAKFLFDGTDFILLNPDPYGVYAKSTGAPVLANNYVVTIMIADNAVTAVKLPAYTTGSYLEGSIAFLSETSLGDVGASYVKKLELKATRSGTVNVRVGLRESNATYNIVGRIYVNTVAQGTERGPTSTTNWQWWNEDITVVAGDLVQLYVHRGGSSAERGSIAMAILCNAPISSGGLYTGVEALSRTDSVESIY